MSKYILSTMTGSNGKDADMTVVNNLASGVTQLKADGEYAQSRIDAANANIQANREAAAATNKRVAENTAAIADHEGRIQSLESSTSSKFSQLNDKIEKNRITLYAEKSAGVIADGFALLPGAFVIDPVSVVKGSSTAASFAATVIQITN